MNCWKTINITREFGVHRLTMIGLIVTIFSFITLYVFLSSLFPGIDFSDNGLSLFIISSLFLVHLHKLTHAIPAWLLRKKTRIDIEWQYHIFPYINVHYCESMSKFTFIVSKLFPSFLITVPMIIASLTFPAYMHYFTMLAALNIGVSITDFIYLYLFFKAPKKCYIENFDGGFDILINNKQ